MIGWSVSHQEFTIEDHYYFSILKSKVNYKLLNSIEEGWDCDVMVFNYPEKPFSSKEIESVVSFVESGKRVIALGYYMDEDGVASLLNELAEPFGIKMLPSSVKDEKNCLNGDPLLITTTKIDRFSQNVSKIVLPCCAPIKTADKDAIVFIYSEKTSTPPSQALGAYRKHGKGEFILLGTCVFWDNFSIVHFDNLRFSLNLLKIP
ncbi:MAG: hypothetical protein J7M13_05770 [Synergistetes bacterium]|nr:hypothetical protein [Synergistota bacterium]